MHFRSAAPRIIAALLLSTTAAFSQNVVTNPQVSFGDHATSVPVHGMREGQVNGPQHDKPLRLIHPNAVTPNQQDPALQTTPVTTSAATTSGLNFLGLGVGFPGFSVNSAPPDTNGAVGATQYVQWVNESFAVFDKLTGNLVKGPVPGNQLYQALGANHPCAVNNDGDPIAQYDKANSRWVLTQFSVTNGGTQGYWQCIAVSQTSDATGKYNVYAFRQPNFNDYPKLGVWSDGYYITYNIFNGNQFAGARLCAYDSSAMRAGTAAAEECFQLSSSFGGVLPGDIDGSIAPPSGASEYMVSFGTNSLNVWLFHADFANSANASLTGPSTVAVAAFTEACSGGTCIPQPSTKQKLDSLGDRLMYRLAYRHFTDGHEALVVNHSVNPGSQVAGVRWYELRPSGSSLTVVQQATYAPADGVNRWMGSIAMDKLGNLAVGFSASSSSVFPAVRYATRAAADAPGTLSGETTVQAGAGSQLRTLNRWGDYSALTVDPVDDCTFWYTNEYLRSSGTFNWSTRIASFKIAGCQ